MQNTHFRLDVKCRFQAEALHELALRCSGFGDFAFERFRQCRGCRKERLIDIKADSIEKICGWVLACRFSGLGFRAFHAFDTTLPGVCRFIFPAKPIHTVCDIRGA